MLQKDFEIFHATIQIEPNPNKIPQTGEKSLVHCISEYNFESEFSKED